jgi:hypothetical protein
MIKRSIIIALAMVIVYNLLLLSPRVRSLYSVQSQWQNNLITAQRYELANPAPKIVVVGSSLAANLPSKQLEPEVYNLSFAGGSAFTGLELIEAAKVKPKIAVIEMNVLGRKSDPDIIQNASRPVFSSLRHHSLAFQEQWQPANLLGGRLTRAPLEKLCSLKDRFAPHEQQATPSMFSRMLAIAQTNNSTPLEPARMAEQIAMLHEHVEKLEKAGVRCVFLEMPVDSSVASLPRCTSIRAKVLEEFPATRYQWISPERNHAYATTDGQHLRHDEAQTFATFVRTALVQTNNWPTWRSASAAN